MDAYSKLTLYNDETHLEVDDEVIFTRPSNPIGYQGALYDKESLTQTKSEDLTGGKYKGDLPIYRAALPNGKSLPLLKTLLTSVCENNCYYCFSRAGRDCQRFTFKPEELAKIYMQIYDAGIASGVFLSSGVFGGGVKTQDRLLATADILRKKYCYQGYLHLKIMPGAERAQVEHAMRLADRVSINLEAPTSQRLVLLAPQKLRIEELIAPLKWVNEIRQTSSTGWGWKGHWPSSTTQFVVGAGGETDLEFLRMSEYLYSHLKLARIYYSGFKPIVGTPLENKPAVNMWRRCRLYQASFLLKAYPFYVEDIPLDQMGNLLLDVDPKIAWARKHLTEDPIEINRAGMYDLMKIPGIGLRGAQKIIKVRNEGMIKDIDQLKASGIFLARAIPFILIAGKRPLFQPELI